MELNRVLFSEAIVGQFATDALVIDVGPVTLIEKWSLGLTN
jgi:hypothetical protein